MKMKKVLLSRRYSLGLLILLFSFILLSFILLKDISYAAYETWDYKVKIKIVNSGGSRTDYPVRILVPAKLYINARRMNEDCRDIRFSDSSGNELPFWISITEGMDRKINSLPVWVKIPSLPSGTSYIYMHFDKDKTKNDEPPIGTYCGDCGSPPSPYCGNNCGDNVFKIFSFDLGDSGDWKSSAYYKNSYTKFVSKERLSNTFSIFFRTHCYTERELIIYFLTQSNENASEIDNYDGYKLSMDWQRSASDNTHYNRGKWILRTYKKSGTGWSQIDSFYWYAYNNSIHDFKILVSSSQIKYYDNGRLLKTISREDSWSGGYVGFNRMNWSTSGEGGSNSTDGISPIWVIDNYVETTSEIRGNADLAIKRIQPTYDTDYTGEDVIEVIPEAQLLEDSVSGNILDEYIFNSYSLAEPDQMFKFKFKIRNRGISSDTFFINISKNGADDWFIAYSYDSYVRTEVLPNGDNTNGSVTLSGGAEKEIEVFIMPSGRVLAEGGLGVLQVDISVQAQNDLSTDICKFIARVEGKAGCYWKWKLPITITYNDTYGTGDLLDYQVLIELSSFNFTDANEDGSDIIFTDSTGTVIPFWKKSFDKANGNAAFWVKVPRINSGSPGSSTIYMWWGNESASSRSDIESTFDLYKDFENRTVDEVVGCHDGTSDCSGLSEDIDGWKNHPTPDDNYNWWRIRSRGGSKVLMADKGPSHTSNDIGPLVTGGDIRWKNYEVLYKSYDEYCNYSGCGNPWGNPQYNPVYYQDPGNEWGMEFFANKYIFRPFAHGTDYTWIYQTYPYGILGESFPRKSKWYWFKVRTFNNPSTGNVHLVIKSTRAGISPSDIDKDTEFIDIGDFNAPPAFALKGGKIGFGGWNGGFSFDNIRVRKYTEPEPSSSIGTAVEVGYRPISSLSFPIVTPPLMNGRPVYLKATLTPWKWKGNLIGLYADCLFLGECAEGEDASKLGTISLWGKVDNNTPKGFGEHLKEAKAAENNRDAINDASWKEHGRYIFTAYDKDSDKKIEGETIGFEVNNKFILRDFLGVSSDDEAENLIRFVRGQYISGYSRSDTRNECETGHDETCQWKLNDIIHSSPLVVGVPNMAYPDEEGCRGKECYSNFMNNYDDRDLVAYFCSNDGMVHAVRLAYYSDALKRHVPDKNATELWAFIPHNILSKLKDTTDNYHEYTTDGLLRAIDIKMGDGYHTVLIGGLRGGGGDLFAIDITKPREPVLLWENDFEGSYDFDQDGDVDSDDETISEHIGKTWSAPALGKLHGEERWVAIFGSGYALNDVEHLEKYAYITVIDLKTGKVLNQIKISNKKGNVATDITAVRDQNGYLERIYFGDLYGCVWRFDLSDADKVSTFMSKETTSETDLLFKPSDYTNSDITQIANFPKRPISSPITVAYGEAQNEYWVYFGTGLYDEYDTNYPYQRFYAIKDTGIEHGLTKSNLANRTCTASYLEGGSLPDYCSASSCEPNCNGWYIELGHTDVRDVEQGGTQSTKDRNERVLSSAEVFAGYVFFNTFTPDDSPCGGGTARTYALEYNTGKVAGEEKKLLDITGEGSFSDEDTVGPEGHKTSARSLKIAPPEIPPGPPFILRGEDKVKIITGGGSGGGPDLNPDILKRINVILWREIK